jgi:GxxExxY protein
MSEIIYKEESYNIVGGCFEVYKEKRCGFLEAVYQECLEIELMLKGISFEAQKPIGLSYKGRPLKQHYVADLVCFGNILIELKAVSSIVDEHRAQILNCLHATGYRLGLLINFGHHPKLQDERIVL